MKSDKYLRGYKLSDNATGYTEWLCGVMMIRLDPVLYSLPLVLFKIK